MTFAHPEILLLGAVASAALAWFLWWSWGKRQELIAQFVQSRLLAQLTVGVSRSLQKLRLKLLFAATVFAFIALAGPRWGFRWEEATTRGRDILIAIDTSRSMLAEDIRPNRLARAKLAALDLLKLAKNDRLGLIAFAGSAFLQCPLTLDEEAFRQSINVLDTGIIPQGGTAIAESIDVAMSAFKKDARENHKVLVLFTDGEDHESGAVEAAKRAADEGVRIFTVGVGTPNGELLKVRDESGALSYVKDEQGNAVKSRLDEALLQQIATEAHGFYLPLAGANTMEMLYQQGLAPLPTSELSSKLVKNYIERFQWPLGIAIALLIAEVFVPERRVPKRAPAAPPQTAPVTAAVAAMLMLCVVSANASPAKAFREYKAGNYKSAEDEYARLVEKKPDDPRLHFNAGSSAYQAQDYERALKEFSTAVGSPDPQLQERAFYNLGNTFYRAGEQLNDPQQKIQTWEQSVKTFDNALKLDAKDADAAFNRDLVKKRLEELKKQQEQQKKDKQQNQQDNKDKKDNKEEQDKNKEKKDQQKQDNKEQQDKDQQQKENQSQEQQQKDKQDQQQQQQKEGQNGQQPDKQDKPQAQAKPDQDPQESKDAAEEASAARQGVMTARQAQQLLDAQRGDEKALIFVPPEKKAARSRTFKDW